MGALKDVVVICILFVTVFQLASCLSVNSDKRCVNSKAATWRCRCHVAYDCCGLGDGKLIKERDNYLIDLNDIDNDLNNFYNLKINGKSNRQQKVKWFGWCRKACFGQLYNFVGLTTPPVYPSTSYITDLNTKGAFCRGIIADAARDPLNVDQVPQGCSLYLRYGRSCKKSQFLDTEYFSSVQGCEELNGAGTYVVYEAGDQTVTFPTGGFAIGVVTPSPP